MSALRDYYTLLTETTSAGGGLNGGEGGGGGGVTTIAVQAAIQAQATAQQAVDDAQDTLAAAEEGDDDAVNAAQDALILANKDLADANEALSMANEAAIALLPTSVDIETAIQAQADAQLIVDAAQDTLAAAEELEDDAVNAAQDALILANKNLADANALGLAMVAALAHDPVPQDELQAALTARVTALEGVDVAALIQAQADAQQAVDDAQDALAVAEEADDDSMVAAQATLDAAQATLIQANADKDAAQDAIDADLETRVTSLENAAPPSAMVETVTGIAVDNTDPLNPVIAEYDDTTVVAATQTAQDTADANGETLALLQTAQDDQALTIAANEDSIDTLGSGQVTQDTAITNLQTDLTTEAQARTDGDTANANALTTEAATRQTEDADLQGQIDTINAGLPSGQTVAQALAADMAALVAEISDTNTDFTNAFALLSGNRVDIDANTAATQTLTAGLATETGERQAADTILQGNIDALQTAQNTADAQNVKLTTDQTIAGVKTFSDIMSVNGMALEGNKITALNGTILTFGNAATVNSKNYAVANASIFSSSTPDNYLTPKKYVDNSIEVVQDALDAEILETNNEQDAQDVLIGKLLDRTKTAKSGELTTTNAAGAIDASNIAADTGNYSAAHSGEYIIEATGLWAYNNAATDIFLDLVQVTGGTSSILMRARQEPKDVAGAGTGGTDQRHNFKLKYPVTLTAGQTTRYYLRYFSATSGEISMVDHALITTQWWSD